MTEFYHKPVMFDEVIQGLDIKDGGIYFDGTAGGGGHSYGILESNPSVRLIATDKDSEAIAAATKRLSVFAGRFSIHKTDYKNYERVLTEEGVDKLDGVLLDFGISSHQIDDPSRGFSYLKEDAPLDMRMAQDAPLTAETVVNEYSEERLYRILRDYGEERFASSIARNIVRERGKKRIQTCGELAKITEESIPVKFRFQGPCARQTFQAIRIEVNGELEGLRECVTGLARKLKTGGRIAILTFHSLEDRIVKEVFRELSEECVCPREFPVCVCGKIKELEPVTKKPITASERELKENSRSKCAKLRIARKL
ncbi:MAG: 16S rRNA (cytosine(1402)-N(4))-methyltransferase RsmH [Clostridia bacterium]|nr:16S rRNA (cytosine(1402)-N(4))-methyltransferase RsmH [Clostridia bacterium]